MPVHLEEVLFNHDPDDKRGSALNLRVNVERPLLLPEWARQADGSIRAAPAAYAARLVVTPLLSVGVRVRWSGPPLASVEVRALQIAARGEAPGRPSVLGELAARNCALAADGFSDRVLLSARGGWLASAPVGIQRIAWRWQYRTSAGAVWTDFATTEHDIFITLLPPSAPWSVGPFVDINVALLWSDALRIACQWASGAYTADEASTMICLRLFALGGSRLEYGCAVFGQEMYTNSVLAIFDCSAMLDRLNGGEGNGRYVNCTDCACTVSTLANALGARLWQGRMGDYVPPFNTRDIRTIGGAGWSSPCNTGLGFMFHEVAWSGNATEFDSVYDASLLLNAQLQPYAPLAPLLAANLGFGVPWGGLYRSMLAQVDDQLICQPQPEERRCRALV